MLNGILWRLRTGAVWWDLPRRYGKWQTVYSRFRRWHEAGVWDRMLTTLQRDGADDGELDETLALLDGSNVQAHQDADGAPKKGGETT